MTEAKPPTGREIADHLQISPARVSQLKAEGMPTASLEEAAAWYARRVDRVRSAGARLGAGAGRTAATLSASSEVPGYETSRARREAAEAKLAELRLAEACGTVVSRADTERAAFTAARILRDQLLASSPRLAAAVVGLSDVGAVERIIAAELRTQLEAFAAACEKLAADGRAQ